MRTLLLKACIGRFLSISDEWSELVNDLWNFHSSYGGMGISETSFLKDPKPSSIDGALNTASRDCGAGDFDSADGTRDYRIQFEQCDCNYAGHESAHPDASLRAAREWAKTTMMP